MAGTGKVVVTDADISEEDETVEQALYTWSTLQTEPCRYNVWQSVYFQLKNLGYPDANAPEGESMRRRQNRLKKMYQEIQLEVHGKVLDSLKIVEDTEDPPARSVEQPLGPAVYEMDGGDTPRDQVNDERFSPDRDLAIPAVSQAWEEGMRRDNETETSEHLSERL